MDKKVEKIIIAHYKEEEARDMDYSLNNMFNVMISYQLGLLIKYGNCARIIDEIIFTLYTHVGIHKEYIENGIYVVINNYKGIIAYMSEGGDVLMESQFPDEIPFHKVHILCSSHQLMLAEWSKDVD